MRKLDGDLHTANETIKYRRWHHEPHLWNYIGDFSVSTILMSSVDKTLWNKVLVQNGDLVSHQCHFHQWFISLAPSFATNWEMTGFKYCLYFGESQIYLSKQDISLGLNIQLPTLTSTSETSQRYYVHSWIFDCRWSSHCKLFLLRVSNSVHGNTSSQWSKLEGFIPDTSLSFTTQTPARPNLSFNLVNSNYVFPHLTTYPAPPSSKLPSSSSELLQ